MIRAWPIGSLVVAALLVSGCGGGDAGSGFADVAQVEYVLEVNGSADVTYATADGGTVQQSRLTSGVVLRESFPADAFVYFSAQATSERSTVSCLVTADGQVVSSNESRGDFVIVTCDGSAVPCPECVEADASAAADAAAKIPYGFAPHADSGLYYNFVEDDEASCGEVTCVTVDVVGEVDCIGGVVVVASQLNAMGRETALGNAKTAAPLMAGDTGRVVIGWESNPENGSLQLESLTCVKRTYP